MERETEQKWSADDNLQQHILNLAHYIRKTKTLGSLVAAQEQATVSPRGDNKNQLFFGLAGNGVITGL